jgi:hypothetical protein
VSGQQTVADIARGISADLARHGKDIGYEQTVAVVTESLTFALMERVDSANHVEVADTHIRSLHGWQADEGQTDATMLSAVLEAQVHATLELAKQQRAANLMFMAERFGHSWPPEQLEYVTSQVTDAIGLPDYVGRTA